jgi:hypothetical protein
MKMVKEIENKVDGCVYALTPVELISEEKSKKNQIQSINK